MSSRKRPLAINTELASDGQVWCRVDGLGTLPRSERPDTPLYGEAAVIAELVAANQVSVLLSLPDGPYPLRATFEEEWPPASRQRPAVRVAVVPFLGDFYMQPLSSTGSRWDVVVVHSASWMVAGREDDFRCAISYDTMVVFVNPNEQELERVLVSPGPDIALPSRHVPRQITRCAELTVTTGHDGDGLLVAAETPEAFRPLRRLLARRSHAITRHPWWRANYDRLEWDDFNLCYQLPRARPSG